MKNQRREGKRNHQSWLKAEVVLSSAKIRDKWLARKWTQSSDAIKETVSIWTPTLFHQACSWLCERFSSQGGRRSGINILGFRESCKITGGERKWTRTSPSESQESGLQRFLSHAVRKKCFQLLDHQKASNLSDFQALHPSVRLKATNLSDYLRTISLSEEQTIIQVF